MDIYVYTGDTPIVGEHTRPQILLPLEDGNFVFNDEEEIGIEVSDGKGTWTKEAIATLIKAMMVGMAKAFPKR